MKKSPAFDVSLDAREETEFATPALACDRDELFARWDKEYRRNLRDGLVARLGRHVRLDVDDAVQEAFFRLHMALSDGASIRHPEAWLWTVARRVMLNKLKRNGREEDALRRGLDWLQATPDLTPEAVLIEKQELFTRLRAQKTLSEIERKCFDLRVSGLKSGAIAKRLGVERRRVPEIIARAVRKMAEKNR